MKVPKELEDKYPKTIEVIKEALNGEAMARNKYDYFSKVARKEGHPKIADFFEETARNEMMHAKLLFRLIDGIGDTKKNLQMCIDDEAEEFESMYPAFAKVAKEENFEAAAKLFEQLTSIEEAHNKRFKRLLEELENKTLYSSKTGEPIAWICQVCGNIEFGENAPERCPVCNHPQGHFERMQKDY